LAYNDTHRLINGNIGSGLHPWSCCIHPEHDVLTEREALTLIYLGLSWLAGIALADWLQPPLPSLWLLALPAVAALLLWRREPLPRLIAVCTLALLAGGMRTVWARPHFGPDDLATYNDRGRVTVTGVIIDEPGVYDTHQKLQLRAESLALHNDPSTAEEIPVTGLALVRAPRYPARAYGDRLTVTGDLETPPVFEDFPYREYLARQHVYSIMSWPRIELLETGQGSPFWSTLYTLKARAQATIALILPEPYAALLTGILLGVETGIPKGLYQQFNATATSHIIVISGFNIAVICGLLMAVGTRTIGRRPAATVTLVGIALYTLLVGADPPVVRAALMGGLSVVALRLGRQTEARTLLVFVAVLMTAINPHVLGDIGFQLSFAATAGLIWLAPPMERAARRWLSALVGPQHVHRATGLLSEALLITLAAQITTTPLILYHFGRLSPVSLLANLLIMPVQPPVMIIGGLATIAGLIWLPAGQLLGWLAWLPLAWTVAVVDWMSALPFASLGIPQFGLGWLVAFYAGLAFLVWRFTGVGSANDPEPSPPVPARLRASTRLMLSVGGMAALVVWLAVSTLPDGRLHVAFLDVGQGDAILITTPRGHQILIDGGPSPTTLLWQMNRHIPFWDRSLDTVINTHPETDHLAGLPVVLERYRVDQVILPDVEARSSLYGAWEQAVSAEGAIVTQVHAGIQLTTQDDVAIEVLHPGDVLSNSDLNNQSVVTRLTMGQVSFLLTGDIDADVERRLVAAHPQLAATVLKVPHHGSNTSSSPALLQATSLQLAILSVGADNHFGHPSPAAVQRYADYGIPLLRTDQVGTIECITDGEQLWVRIGH